MRREGVGFRGGNGAGRRAVLFVLLKMIFVPRWLIENFLGRAGLAVSLAPNDSASPSSLAAAGGKTSRNNSDETKETAEGNRDKMGDKIAGAIRGRCKEQVRGK